MDLSKSPSYSTSKILRIFFSVLVFCFSLTILFLAMRAVLGVGGFCAEGGPYEIAVHCPKGVAPLAAFAPITMIASIFVYLSAAGVTGVLFFWSAIFLSLGWNFMEFALYPPVGEGPVYAWIICGVMFILMGIGPFIYVTKAFFDGFLGKVMAQPGEGRPDMRSFLLHLVGIALGVGLGIYLFKLVAS